MKKEIKEALKEVQKANDELIKKEFVEREFNFRERLKEMLSLERFGKGRNNDDIFGLFEEFIKWLKEEIDLVFKINEENGLESGVSDKLTKEILDICNGIKDEINRIIDALAGEKITNGNI